MQRFRFFVFRVGGEKSSPLRGQGCDVWKVSTSLCLVSMGTGPLRCAVGSAKCGKLPLRCVQNRCRGDIFAARSEVRSVERSPFVVFRIGEEGKPRNSLKKLRALRTGKLGSATPGSETSGAIKELHVPQRPRGS